jgi:hypothetical protein
MCLTYFRSLVVDGTKVLFREVDALPLNQHIPAAISYIDLDGVEVQIPLQGLDVMTAFGAGYRERQIPATRRLACFACMIFPISCFLLCHELPWRLGAQDYFICLVFYTPAEGVEMIAILTNHQSKT